MSARPHRSASSAPPTGDLVSALATPEVELIETHISWVFLAATEVWKVKKSVDLGFLDYSTLAKRRAACENEARLNQRLAPGVYLGTVPITRDASGSPRFGGSGPVVDWAVHMVRLSDDHRADFRLADGTLGLAEIEKIAARLAGFHRLARADEEFRRFGNLETITFNVQENFTQTRQTLPLYLSRDEAAEAEIWQLRFLEQHAGLFAERAAGGRVRDGHGDLRLEHVYLDGDDVKIIDCIEFNDRFRFADVAADVAFLAMDLTWHGCADLAEIFLAAYAREADDFDLYPLVDFYESYRAFVRGKVASFLAAQEGLDLAQRQRAESEARRFYLLALAAERRALLPPVLVAVGGIIASGKSTVARQVAAQMAVPIVEADRTRKAMLGIAPEEPVHDPAWQGAYAPSISDEVYAEVLRRAGVVLTSGRAVVLDASFRGRELRDAARRLATEHGARFLFIECRVPLGVARQRLRRRAEKSSVSDGRLEIFDDFVTHWQSVDELPDAQHLVFDTDQPLAANLQLIRQRLPVWPATPVERMSDRAEI